MKRQPAGLVNQGGRDQRDHNGGGGQEEDNHMTPVHELASAVRPRRGDQGSRLQDADTGGEQIDQRNRKRVAGQDPVKTNAVVAASAMRRRPSSTRAAVIIWQPTAKSKPGNWIRKGPESGGYPKKPLVARR